MFLINGGCELEKEVVECLFDKIGFEVIIFKVYGYFLCVFGGIGVDGVEGVSRVRVFWD